MTRVHPNYSSPLPSLELTAVVGEVEEAAMTVWRKSLLFNCEGFTVFDGRGDLRFRVDSYLAGRRGEVVLMDACGNSLYTVRRKRLSLGDSWLIYEGDERANPLYSLKRHVTLLHSKGLAHVTPSRSQNHNPNSYIVEGSYTQRTCKIYDSFRHVVAEIQQKETAAGVTLGGDVFRLIVKPGFDSALSMAMVIALEEIHR